MRPPPWCLGRGRYDVSLHLHKLLLPLAVRRRSLASFTSAGGGGSAVEGAGAAGAPSADYLQRQRERLLASKEFDVAVAMGKLPPGHVGFFQGLVDEAARAPLKFGTVTAAVALGAGGYYWWQRSTMADAAEMNRFLGEKEQEERVVRLPSGLLYKVLKEGEGRHHPTRSSPCSCHYRGTLVDGTEFDSSYGRGEPSTFRPDQVIKGWTEAMQLMVEGDQWELYVPAHLAYGDGGSGASIPGGAALTFQIELLRIDGPRVRASTRSAREEGR